jgi:hypothetical protein
MQCLTCAWLPTKVLGAGFKTVRWEQKTARELEELFGSEDRAREIQQLDGAQKDRVMNSVKAQIKELAKYQEEIAHHYAFCQEVLKRASDAPQIDALVLKYGLPLDPGIGQGQEKQN